MMSNFSVAEGVKIEPIDKDLLILLNRILDQNERILRLNERMLGAFELPRLFHQIPHLEDKHFK